MVKVKDVGDVGFYMDGYLKSCMDSLVWNINKDWDFIIIITGDNLVRSGKSVLGLQIGTYLAKQLGTPFGLDNVFFDSNDMIAKAQDAPKNSVFIFDEARVALASSKRFLKTQQDLMDYFNECGQLNHVFILILPDFFSLTNEIATNRSELLLNVYRFEENTEKMVNGVATPITVFHRGRFELFNRKTKATLYWQGKRSGLRNYGMVKANAVCTFPHYYPVDEEAYREKKREMLTRFIQRHREDDSELQQRGNKFKMERIVDGIIYTQKYIYKKNNKEIAQHLEELSGEKTSDDYVSIRLKWINKKHNINDKESNKDVGIIPYKTREKEPVVSELSETRNISYIDDLEEQHEISKT